ncbi:hypothetical protein FISHEDRAFT_59371 [Fistulina hepatica ATCC 64428]|uniref:F-box domain-containing protein n=1 Tax=Fistulina hepatica ATCC 64428 TaxID=1128425 RepID=A0A0D7A9S0_9AGAR|nr:hypothetical protein FISHEDRAFT_59371 [Fistulina hepatica ATCC 64428]
MYQQQRGQTERERRQTGTRRSLGKTMHRKLRAFLEILHYTTFILRVVIALSRNEGRELLMAVRSLARKSPPIEHAAIVHDTDTTVLSTNNCGAELKTSHSPLCAPPATIHDLPNELLCTIFLAALPNPYVLYVEHIDRVCLPFAVPEILAPPYVCRHWRAVCESLLPFMPTMLDLSCPRYLSGEAIQRRMRKIFSIIYDILGLSPTPASCVVPRPEPAPPYPNRRRRRTQLQLVQLDSVRLDDDAIPIDEYLPASLLLQMAPRWKSVTMRINTCTFHQLSGSVVDFPRLHELTLDLFFPGRLNVTYLLDLPFQLFTAAPHLQRLDLSVGPFLRPTQVFLPWKQLTDISMYIPQPNGWLAHLVHCASLRVLRLRGGARPLGDVFLCFPHLTHLAVRGRAFTAPFLCMIAAPTLHSLALDVADLIMSITYSALLTFVQRSQCTVRTACFFLDALSLSVGDASLLQLAVLQSLEVLSDVTSLEVLGTFTPPLLHPLLLNLVCKDQIHLWDEQPEGPPPFRLVPKLERLTLYPTKQLNVHSWDMTFILRFAESRCLLISRNGDAHWGHRVGGPRTFHTLRLGFAPGQVRYSDLRVVGFGKNMKYVSDEWDVYSGQKPYDDMMRLKRVAASHEETICDLMGKGLDVVFSAQPEGELSEWISKDWEY